jgi:hypothetical protein
VDERLFDEPTKVRMKEGFGSLGNSGFLYGTQNDFCEDERGTFDV